MAMTSYNSYDCTKDRRHLFTPEELETVAAADAKIEAEYEAEDDDDSDAGTTDGLA